MLLGVALVVVSAAGGVYFGVLWTQYSLHAMREIHTREMNEIFAEITRLRAQAANLIGRE
jgi:hypothetical protein